MKRANEYAIPHNRKNNQSVFGVVRGLNRVIPTVEGFKDRTNKAG
jgi:hypothetical protein